MPFLAPLGLTIAGALGAAVPTALSVGVPAAMGALGLAQGIAKKDPFAILSGVTSGVLGGLGGIGGVGDIANTVGSASDAVSSAASAAGGIANPLFQGVSQASNVIPNLPDISKYVGGSAKNLGMPQMIPEVSAPEGVAYLAPASQGSSLTDKFTKGLEVANALGATAGGIYGAFQGDDQPGSRMSLPGIDTNLPSFPGANAPGLPGVDMYQVPNLDLSQKFADNQTLLELLGAYQI